MTDKTLKPCPFCDSINVSSGEIAGKDCEGNFFVATACNDCGAEGPRVYEHEKDDSICFDDAADQKWNTRTDKHTLLTEVIEAVRNMEADHSISYAYLLEKSDVIKLLYAMRDDNLTVRGWYE